MYEKKVSIKRAHGLHLRPAAEFVKRAQAFKSSITLCYNGQTVPASSLFQLQTLSLTQGSEVTLSATGGDEKIAVEQLSRFLAEPEEGEPL